VGIANNYTAVWAVGADGTRDSADDADHAAAAGYDLLHNRLFTEPLLLGSYPPGYEMLAGGDVDRVVLDGDLEVISAPLDWLGVNYYNPTGVGAPAPGCTDVHPDPMVNHRMRSYHGDHRTHSALHQKDSRLHDQAERGQFHAHLVDHCGPNL
jgi:beta-glucosidase/6-phospho-beta-glucosidase/beta-galactosidase